MFFDEQAASCAAEYLDTGECMEYRDKSRLIGWVGIFLLLAGLGAAILGPVEMYCFYLFSEGGRFHFKGFGFGSIVFIPIP